MRCSFRDILSLAAGEPDFNTPQAIVDAGIRAMTSGETHYTMTTGTTELRTAIATKLKG